MMLWFKGLAIAQKIAIAVVAALLLIAAVAFVYNLLTGSDKVKGKLGQNQADAAISSATDAVGTVSGQSELEAARTRELEKTKGEVDEATDTAGAHDAGSSFLCHNLGVCSEE